MSSEAPRKKTCMFCVIMRLWLVSLVLLYLMSDKLFAAELNVTNELEYFFDVEGQFTIDKVVDPANGVSWVKNVVGKLNLGFSDHTLWVRLPVDLKIPRSRALLEIPWPFLDTVNGYWVVDGKVTHLGQQGDHWPDAKRHLNHRFVIYELPGEYEVKGTVYLKVNSASSLLMPMWIRTADKFSLYEIRNQIFLGFIFIYTPFFFAIYRREPTF